MNTTYQRRLDILSSQIGSDIVLFDDENSCYFSMNEVGSKIWGFLTTPKTSSQIVEELCLSYEVSKEQAQSEVAPFLKELLSRNLVATL